MFLLLIIMGIIALWGVQANVWTELEWRLSVSQGQVSAGLICFAALLVVLIVFLLLKIKIPKLICFLHSTVFYGLLAAGLFLDEPSRNLLGTTLESLLGGIFKMFCDGVDALTSKGILFKILGVVLVLCVVGVILIVVMVSFMIPFCFGKIGNRDLDILDSDDCWWIIPSVIVAGVVFFIAGKIFNALDSSSFAFCLYLCVASWLLSLASIFASFPSELSYLDEKFVDLCECIRDSFSGGSPGGNEDRKYEI